MKERRACWRRRRVGSDLGDGGGILWLEEEEEEEVLVACVEAPGSCVRVGGVGGMAWVGGWMDGCNTQACTPRCLGELQRYVVKGTNALPTHARILCVSLLPLLEHALAGLCVRGGVCFVCVCRLAGR